MPTEEYKGWKPWVCPGCSAELQFSDAYGWIVQLCFFGVALFALYLLGFRGWKLLGAAVLAAALLTVVLIGPLGRILPPGLEPYRPSPWKKDKEEDKFETLFPHERADSDNPKQTDQSADEPPKEL
jgi:hypothetical protein